MYKSKFNRDPFQYQVDVVKIMTALPNRVVGMFYPTGKGKTMAMEGCVMALGGITLFHAPTVGLAEFQTNRFHKDGFQVVNLEDIQTTEDAKALKNFVDEMKKDRKKLKKQRCIVVCSPASFADEDFEWYKYFARLGRSGLLKLVVIDECHLTPQHGKVFRIEQYRLFLENFLHTITKREKIRPQILFASATMDKEGLEELEEMCQTKLTNRCHATPKEMAQRHLHFHMCCRSLAHSVPMIKSLVVERVFKADDGGKVIVSTNSKKRVPSLQDHLRRAALDTPKSHVNVVALHGDTPSMLKKTGISLFCGQMPECELSPDTLAMVASANMGAEGYDNPYIRTFVHEGVPTSVAQHKQEAGRCRCVDTGKSHEYHMFACLQSFLHSR